MRQRHLEVTELEMVTPQQAAAWWETRGPHRKHREEHAQMLAAAMRDGTFKAGEGKPIKIIAGALGNGQHRVRAVIITNEPQILCVTRIRHT